jgi:DNA-directed RNA polymerase sigma subunit (sigma70/sigma32)
MMYAKMTDTQIIEFVENLPETCIIDVIQKNTTYHGKGATLNVIAGIMGVTRERVRQVEKQAFNKIRNWRRRSHLQHHAKDVYGVEKDPYLTTHPLPAGHREWREVT